MELYFKWKFIKEFIGDIIPWIVLGLPILYIIICSIIVSIKEKLNKNKE